MFVFNHFDLHFPGLLVFKIENDTGNLLHINNYSIKPGMKILFIDISIPGFLLSSNNFLMMIQHTEISVLIFKKEPLDPKQKFCGSQIGGNPLFTN